MSDVIGTLFHKEIPYGGVKGDKGDTGATPNVSATASVDSSTGTPSVNVVKTGTAENPSFEFAFSNLKGEKGDPGSGSSVSWGEIDGDITDQTDLSTELAKKYDENDTAETDIQDTDYVPFYDTSATGKRKSLWSNIKAKLKAYFDEIYTLLTIVGTVESGTTASKRYEIGNHFIKDGYFCTAIAAIAQGATLTLNTNYTQGDIADAIENKRTDTLNQVDGGQYITTIFAATITEKNGLNIIQLSLGFKARTGGTGGFVDLFTIPNTYKIGEVVGPWTITSAGNHVQFRIGTDNTVKFYAPASIGTNEGATILIPIFE